LSIPEDLHISIRKVFEPAGFTCHHVEAEVESSAYCAYTFQLNELFILYRHAKITPTKSGQFVTLWKRINDGPIQPFDLSDQVDFIIISSRFDKRFGIFIFPKMVLLEQGVLSGGKKPGKRAIRVYPPWDLLSSAQAIKTQGWQLPFFLEIPADAAIDLNRIKNLLTL